jgi:pimeloyl-ACP methyl ester carboxylesterase
MKAKSRDFGRIVVTAGLTSLTLGLLARGWSWARHGPSRTLPPPDCPPRGARIAGFEVARRELGSVRSATIIVLVHDRDSTGERMLDAVDGLRGPAIVLAPTAPMPTTEGAAWTWADPSDGGFVWVLEGAAHGFAAFAREVRRCNPGRRVILVGHGQGAHVSSAAASFDPTIADELILIGTYWTHPWTPGALPTTTMIHGTEAEDFDAAEQLAAAWIEHGLPVRWVALDGDLELTGAMQARLLAELGRALAGRSTL